MFGSRIKKLKLTTLAEDFKSIGLVLPEDVDKDSEVGASPASATVAPEAPAAVTPPPAAPVAAPAAAPEAGAAAVTPPKTEGVLPPALAAHIKAKKAGDKHGDAKKALLLELPAGLKKFQKHAEAPVEPEDSEHEEEKEEEEKAAHESMTARIDSLIEDARALVSGLSESEDPSFKISDAVKAYANVAVISSRLAEQFAEFVENTELSEAVSEAGCELSDVFASLAEDAADSAVELSQVTEATVEDLDADAVQSDFKEVMESLIQGLETYRELTEDEEGEEGKHAEHEAGESEEEEEKEHEEKPAVDEEEEDEDVEHKEEEEEEESPKGEK